MKDNDSANARLVQIGTRFPLKVNMLINAVKSVTSIIFPLITFPYISRVLDVDGIGRYQVAHSILSYFLLLVGWGIKNYAIREGTRLRDGEEFPRFADEFFSISVCFTVLAYILMAITIVAVPKLREYSTILAVLSLQIAFTTLGVEWVYSIFEDYLYITLRNIAFQILSLILMFIFVRTPDDVLIYAGIVTLSATGSNVINYVHSKRYCKIKFTREIDWKRHIKPILFLIASSLTVTIYVSSDTTILGFLCGDYTVGIYSVSVKVYTTVTTLLSSILVVSIPRLSSLLGKKDMQAFRQEALDIYSTLLTFVAPAILGIILLRRPIILLLSGRAFLSAASSMALLSIALFFCMGAWFWGQCILLPLKKDAVNFRITIISALINIVLNFILIPVWKENAAAFTTILAEGFSCLGCWYIGRKYVRIKGIGKIAIKIAGGCLSILLVWWVLHLLLSDLLLNAICTVIASIVVYLVVEVLLRNPAIVNPLRSVLLRVKR